MVIKKKLIINGLEAAEFELIKVNKTFTLLNGTNFLLNNLSRWRVFIRPKYRDHKVHKKITFKFKPGAKVCGLVIKKCVVWYGQPLYICCWKRHFIHEHFLELVGGFKG